MTTIAAILRPDVARAILDAQGLSTEASLIRSCGGPPGGERFEIWSRLRHGTAVRCVGAADQPQGEEPSFSEVEALDPNERVHAA